MKSPLCYQATCSDCGKASAINAFMYLYEREDIPPMVIDYLARVTGDGNLAVNGMLRGTSGSALAFVAAWCNNYLVKTGFPIRCQALAGDGEVSMAEGSPLLEGLRDGAVAICGCRLFTDHYVLITGLEGERGSERVRVFDPYYDTWPLQEMPADVEGIDMVWDQPFTHNRLIDRAVFDAPRGVPYSLSTVCGRDAVLLWNTAGKDGGGCA